MGFKRKVPHDKILSVFLSSPCPVHVNPHAGGDPGKIAVFLPLRLHDRAPRRASCASAHC